MTVLGSIDPEYDDYIKRMGTFTFNPPTNTTRFTCFKKYVIYMRRMRNCQSLVRSKTRKIPIFFCLFDPTFFL